MSEAENLMFDLKDWDEIYNSLEDLNAVDLWGVGHVEDLSFLENNASTNNDFISNAKSTEKNDINSYAKLIEHGINAHDHLELYETLATCCKSDVKLIAHYPKGNPYGYAYRQINGLETCVNYLNVQFSCAPDHILFVHHSEVVHTEQGETILKIKFTGNGTRLYTLVDEQHGQKLPDPPSIVKLYKDIAKVCPKVASERERYHTKTEHLVIRHSQDKNISKFDRYHLHNKTDTMGTAFEYQYFSESSMQSRKKKHGEDVEVEDEDHIITARRPSREIKNIPSVASLTAARIARLSSKYTEDTQLIADAETTFSFSPMLPISVPLDVFGVLKLFFAGESDKAYMMEMMLHAKRKSHVTNAVAVGVKIEDGEIE